MSSTFAQVKISRFGILFGPFSDTFTISTFAELKISRFGTFVGPFRGTFMTCTHAEVKISRFGAFLRPFSDTFMTNTFAEVKISHFGPLSNLFEIPSRHFHEYIYCILILRGTFTAPLRVRFLTGSARSIRCLGFVEVKKRTVSSRLLNSSQFTFAAA